MTADPSAKATPTGSLSSRDVLSDTLNGTKGDHPWSHNAIAWAARCLLVGAGVVVALMGAILNEPRQPLRRAESEPDGTPHASRFPIKLLVLDLDGTLVHVTLRRRDLIGRVIKVSKSYSISPVCLVSIVALFSIAERARRFAFRRGIPTDSLQGMTGRLASLRLIPKSAEGRSLKGVLVSGFDEESSFKVARERELLADAEHPAEVIMKLTTLNAARALQASGAMDLLEGCQAIGLHCVVLTQANKEYAETALRASNLRGYIGEVIGEDSGMGAKPNPDPLIALMRARALSPEQVIVAGDSSADSEMASAAGVLFFGVGGHTRSERIYGPWTHRDQWEGARPQSLNDLAALLAKWRAPSPGQHNKLV